MFLRKWNHSDPSTLSLENHQLIDFNVSPNPANDLVKITAGDSGLVRIMDLNGSVVHEQYVHSGTTELDLGSVKKGIYLVQLGAKTSKIVLN
ncbi:hypothetical protein D3C86_1363230 [compost metagenome]